MATDNPIPFRVRIALIAAVLALLAIMLAAADGSVSHDALFFGSVTAFPLPYLLNARMHRRWLIVRSRFQKWRMKRHLMANALAEYREARADGDEALMEVALRAYHAACRE